MGIHEVLPMDRCQTEESSGAERWDQEILVNTDTCCLRQVHWTLEEGDTQSHSRKWWPLWILAPTL